LQLYTLIHYGIIEFMRQNIENAAFSVNFPFSFEYSPTNIPPDVRHPLHRTRKSSPKKNAGVWGGETQPDSPRMGRSTTDVLYSLIYYIIDISVDTAVWTNEATPFSGGGEKQNKAKGRSVAEKLLRGVDWSG